MAHKPVRMLTPVDTAARAKIQASRLVTRLMDFVDSNDYDESDYDDPDDVIPTKLKDKRAENRKKRMSPAQVTAALGLIKKVIPDMAAVQISGNAEEPLVITEIRRTVVDPKNFEDA